MVKSFCFSSLAIYVALAAVLVLATVIFLKILLLKIGLKHHV